jgi:hypothetical protein
MIGKRNINGGIISKMSGSTEKKFGWDEKQQPRWIDRLSLLKIP